MKAHHTLEPWYWEMLVKCLSTSEEIVTYLLFEIGATGIEEISRSQTFLDLKVYFSAKTTDPAADTGRVIDTANSSLAGFEIISVNKKPVEDWQDNWKKYFKPLEIGEDLLVIPPWLTSASQRKKIVIQPGFGFGTGYHESTNLALQLLEGLAAHHSFNLVLDVGCGSGVLSIAGLLLSECRVTAIDIDPDAVKEVPHNLELSGVDVSRCQVITATPQDLAGESFDLVMANIEDHLLSPMSAELIRLTRPGGRLLLSGILTERKQTLLAAFANEVDVIEEKTMNEWTGLVLQRTPRQ